MKSLTDLLSAKPSSEAAAVKIAAIRDLLKALSSKGGRRLTLSLPPFKLRARNGFQPDDVREAVRVYYELGMFSEMLGREVVRPTETNSLRDFLANPIGPVSRHARAKIGDLVDERIIRELTASSFEVALERLGFLGPRNSVDAVRRFKARYQRFFDMAWWSAVNVPFSVIFGTPPLSLPRLKVTDGAKIPEALSRKVRESGFEAVREDLRSLYRGRVGFDYAFDWAGKVYAASMLTFVLANLVSAYPMIKFSVAAYFTDDDDVVEAGQKRSIDDLRSMHFEAWKSTFVEFEGEPSAEVNVRVEEWRMLLTKDSDSRSLADQFSAGLARQDQRYVREYFHHYQKIFLQYSEEDLRGN